MPRNDRYRVHVDENGSTGARRVPLLREIREREPEVAAPRFPEERNVQEWINQNPDARSKCSPTEYVSNESYATALGSAELVTPATRRRRVRFAQEEDRIASRRHRSPPVAGRRSRRNSIQRDDTPPGRLPYEPAYGITDRQLMWMYTGRAYGPDEEIPPGIAVIQEREEPLIMKGNDDPQYTIARIMKAYQKNDMKYLNDKLTRVTIQGRHQKEAQRKKEKANPEIIPEEPCQQEEHHLDNLEKWAELPFPETSMNDISLSSTISSCRTWKEMSQVLKESPTLHPSSTQKTLQSNNPSSFLTLGTENFKNCACYKKE